MNQPTDEQIAKVADSIYRHLCKNTEVMHIAASDALDDMELLGEMLCRDMVCIVGISIHEAAHNTIRRYAKDMAERWFHDNFMRCEKEWLAEWAPYKHRHVGYYHEWLERLP